MMWTLAQASLDGALVVGAIWVMSRMFPLSPATRTLLWWCAAAKFVLGLAWTAPIAIPILPAERLAPIAATRLTAANAVASPVESALEIPRHSRASTVSTRSASRSGVASAADRLFTGIGEWSSFAALGWIGGLLLLGFVAVRRWSATAALVRASTPADSEVHARVLELASRLRLRRVPAVRVSDRIATPLVTGFVRPVVLLPGDRFTALSERQRDMALCHELAHLKRADLWLGCVPALAERLFFFHPLAHFVSREYSLAREAACDAAVVDTLDAAPREYGCLLLALGVSRPQAGAAANAAWSFVHLKRRIAMLQELPPSPRRSRLAAAAAVAVAVLALVPLRLVARPAQPVPLTPAEVATAQHDRAVARAARDVEVPAPVESVEQERSEQAPKDLSFVLMTEGNQTVSGSEQDLARARSFQRDGAPLLWVRRNGREYVIRDEDVLRQAREAWQAFRKKELDQFAPGHLEDMAKALVDSPMIAEAGRLGAEMGGHAMEMAAEALRSLADQDFESLKDLKGLKELKDFKELKYFESLKELEELKHLQKLDKLREHAELRDLESSMRELHKSLAEVDAQTQHEIARSVRDALDEHREDLRALKDHLREMEHPIREMAEPFAEMGRHMGDVGREIGEATARAMEQMRDVIERAIASGRARSVK